MKLWLLSQNKNSGYDRYDSCVVVAETEEDAKKIHPDGKSVYKYGCEEMETEEKYDWFETRRNGTLYADWGSWATTPLDVKATYIGEADSKLEAGEVVCASFNAG